MILNKMCVEFLDKSLLRRTKNKRTLVLFWMKLVFILFISIVFLSSPTIVFGQSTNNIATSSPYSFTLSSAATTSAGVYRSSDSTLVRTLWTTVKYNAGTYNINWDGKDDAGKPAPAGNYTVHVVSNNVQYNWMGVIGNTSTVDTGSTVHRSLYYFMTGMTILNGTAYYCDGYSEARPSIYKLLTSKPQQKLYIEKPNSTTATTNIVVSDGTTLYWAGYDPYSTNNSFVYGTRVSDDSYVKFQGSVSFKPQLATVTYNAISYFNQVNSLITGLAVQKKGNFLFVARAGLNQLAVLDKTTGLVIQTLTINNPQALCTDMNDNLWMVSNGNNVSKYKLNANGTLSSPLLTISSVSAAIALAVSPDNSTIAIADGTLSSQQVKAFDNLTGSPSWTLGTPGGYMQDATATNNKFYFNDVRGKMYAHGLQGEGFLVFIAFQPDGSFWVNDPGNYRVQHYSANRTFIETIMALGPSYCTWADKNNNTRVGAEYLEFKIDNTQPLSGSSGWQLAKNWGATVAATYDPTTKFTNFITLTSAGVSRTFGFLRMSNYYYLVEFQSNNSLRFTGISRLHCNIEKDGSLLTDNGFRYAFQGFDSANNPIWSNTPVMLANTLLLQKNGPFLHQWINNTYVTSSGKVVFYDAGIQQSNNPVVYDTGYHLGAIQMGGSSYLWETAMSTNRNYSGSFPDASHFDVGNNVNNNAGSSVMVSGRNIVTGYHGEFWKNGQTNKYNHYFDNGLAIGQFGVTWTETVGECPPMMAGNALSPQLIDGANSDELYLWHGDESWHAGMHKWKISGLHTIKDTAISIIYPFAASNSTVPGVDLMAGLPGNAVVQNGSFGWNRTPAVEDYTNKYSQFWSVTTGTRSYSLGSLDVFTNYRQNSGISTVTRDLGNNQSLTSWTLNGKLNWDTNYANSQNGAGGSYIEILDNNGKIIARLYSVETYTTTYNHAIHIYGNQQVLTQGPISSIQAITKQSQYFEINAVGGNITFKYANYSVSTSQLVDPTANWRNPKTFRLYFWTNNTLSNLPRVIDIEAARFTSNTVTQTISFNSIPQKYYGNSPFTLLATSSSNLPVTFTVVSGPAQISGNTIILTGTGTVVVQASQAGNSLYNAATSVTQSFNIGNQNVSRIDH
jgi:hypothetical protein